MMFKTAELGLSKVEDWKYWRGGEFKPPGTWGDKKVYIVWSCCGWQECEARVGNELDQRLAGLCDAGRGKGRGKAPWGLQKFIFLHISHVDRGRGKLDGETNGSGEAHRYLVEMLF